MSLTGQEKRKVLFDEKCLELAEHFLQDEPSDLLDPEVLAGSIQTLIEGAIEYARSNYDPAPYCSAGHRSRESCDCGPIAENE